jgi:hypothetical protein
VDFVAVVDQVIALLHQRGRVTSRTLQIQCTLDDEQLAALKDKLLYSQPQAVDDAGRGLIWSGDTGIAPAATFTPVASSPQAPLASTPAEPLARRAASRMASALGASDRHSVFVWSALGKEHSYGTPPAVSYVLWLALLRGLPASIRGTGAPSMAPKLALISRGLA